MTVSVSSSPASTTARRLRRMQTAAYFAINIAIGLMASLLGPTLAGLAAHTHSTLSQVSILFTALALGGILGSARGGRLYDRLPGHPVMVGAFAVIVTMLVLIPQLPWLWLVALALLTMGAAERTLDVGGNTLLVWLHGRQVSPYMNALHFFFGLGAFLSPLIIGRVIAWSNDITWAYRIIALLILPVGLWLWRLPSPPRQIVSRSTPAGRIPWGLVLLIALFYFLYVGAEVSFGGWIFTYAVAQGAGTPVTAAYLTSFFWGALTVGRLLSIPLATRLAPQTLLAVDLVGCLLSGGALLLWPAVPAVIWAGAAGMGLCMAAIFPTMLSFAERRMAISGQVTGWLFVGGSAGGMFLPWLIGTLFERIGPVVTMIGIGVDLLLAAFVFAGLLIYSPPPAASALQTRLSTK